MVKKSSRTIVIPSSLAEANASLFRIGQLERSVATMESNLASAVAELRKAADTRVTPLLAEQSDLAMGLKLFAEANRETILIDDKKSVELSAGIFGWRFTPPKVEFLRGGAKKALALLKELKLKRYIRIKESIDKEALLKDRPDVQGIKYTQREEFFCEASSNVDGGPEPMIHIIALVKAA